MERTKYTPLEVSGQGIQAVHQRPFCANEDSQIVGRFDAKTAWATFPKLELQPPHAYAAIILDCDSDSIQNLETPGKAWWGSTPTPTPSWLVVNIRPKTATRRAGGIHCVYALEVPVARHSAAHTAPLSYLAHIADRLAHHLGADPRYTGLITRNPINPGHECYTHWSRMFPYTLGELDKLLPKGKPPSRRQTGIGRNCDLFKSMISEVFRPRWADTLGAQGWSEAWLDHVRGQNVSMFPDAFLPDSECRSIAKSCYRYWTRHYSPGRFSEIQRSRMGKRWHGDMDFDFDKQSVDVRELKAIGLTQASVGAILGLSQALPNAVLVGFTGTPIDKGFGRSTMGHFGSLIDAYTVPQSVADGATVPIMYEARLPELNIQGPETLDKLFDAIFHEEAEEERAHIRRRYANKETIAEAEQRIQMISMDIAEHFKTKVRPNGFKAQVVAPSRAAALRYSRFLNDFGVRAYPIITTSANDGPEFQDALGLNQDQITNAFVDPDGEPDVLVVVDMLLTGFDAPVEQVLYLDRSLREHGLLQAVARVNRRFSHEHEKVLTEKNYGLVVDYHGVAQDLHEALESFDWPDVQDTMIPIEDDPTAVIDATAVRAEAHFYGRGLDDTWDCVALFAADKNTEGDFKADLFERFNHDYRQFSSLMDRILPDPRALPYADRLARLTEIRAYTRAQYLRENANLDWTDIGAKVKKLIDDRIDADVRKLMEPVSVLDEDFEEKVASLPHDEARASVMEHAIRAYINTRLADNPAFFEKLSEQLERIIRDLRDHVIDSAEAMRQADLLKRQLHTEEDVAAEHGLSPVSFAIFELIRTRDGDTAPGAWSEQDVKGAALALDGVIKQHTGVVEWQSNPDVQRLMRRDIKRELRPSGNYGEPQLDELANRIVEMAQRRGGH